MLGKDSFHEGYTRLSRDQVEVKLFREETKENTLMIASEGWKKLAMLASI